jgi:hypothetical protein
MKYLLLIVLAICLVSAGYAPTAYAFKDMDMAELQKRADAADTEAQTQLGVAYAKGTGRNKSAGGRQVVSQSG